jgi:hypothetical protein
MAAAIYSNFVHVANIAIVDYMLDDCFQLISLAYLTVGKNHEPPAVYVDFGQLSYELANMMTQIFIHLHDKGRTC